MAYTSVPYRGLSVLLDAWDLLKPSAAELHIWSSIKIYGPEFDDNRYKDLYERALSLPGVEYHGIVPNSELRAALLSMDYLTYPSTFLETSCLAVIEAMAAGCRVICPADGALPETTAGFARLYPSHVDPHIHAQRFAKTLDDEINNPWEGNIELIEQQQAHIKSHYDWQVRAVEWKIFIQSINEGNGMQTHYLEALS